MESKWFGPWVVQENGTHTGIYLTKSIDSGIKITAARCDLLLLEERTSEEVTPVLEGRFEETINEPDSGGVLQSSSLWIRLPTTAKVYDDPEKV